MNKTTLGLQALAAAGLALSATGAHAQASIAVDVNGQAIQFTGAPPIEVNNSVLVPLRGVFEALGASVNYDSSSKTITASNANDNVVLQLGSTIASVNGQTQMLSQAARVQDGTTLVPLRFVAQALGAQVSWNDATSTVEIYTSQPQLTTLPPPAPNPSPSGKIEGTLTQVVSDGNSPQITIHRHGQDTAIPVTDSTIILASAVGKPGIQISLDRLRPGELARVTLDDSGNAQTIQITFNQAEGKITSVGRLGNGDRVVTLDDGTTIELSPDATITLGDQPVDFRDLRPGAQVLVRSNPDTSLAFQLEVYVRNNPGPGNGGNPHPTGTPATVTSFAQDANRPLRGGDVLTARLTGTPGGTAVFSIPGVAENVPMQENPAGTYTGSYVVGKDISVTGAAVLAKLQVGDSVSPIIQANGTVTIDSIPPQITEFSPGDGSAVSSNLPQIYGTISDRGGLGIEPSRVRIDLDDNDVTSQATVTPVFFNLQLGQPLSDGRHTVRVRLQDRAGNETEARWSFSVGSNNVVREFTSDAENHGPVADGSTIGFTLKATPGGRATFGIGNLARDVPMKETSPGVYSGAYTVHSGQDIKDAPVTATFIDNTGARVQTSLRSGITIAAGPPRAPEIISPENGASVGSTLNIRGKAAPDSTVEVKVEFSSKVLGGLMSVNGAVASKEVKSDDHGDWEVDKISMQPGSMLGSANSRIYTITATAQNAAGEISDPTKISVRP